MGPTFQSFALIIPPPPRQDKRESHNNTLMEKIWRLKNIFARSNELAPSTPLSYDNHPAVRVAASPPRLCHLASCSSGIYKHEEDQFVWNASFQHEENRFLVQTRRPWFTSYKWHTPPWFTSGIRRLQDRYDLGLVPWS